jgi:hypothetical protein
MSASAELFACTNRAHHVECYRFSSAAKATRHPIEEFPPKLHGGLVMEANEIRYRASEILSLYHRPDYPFARRIMMIFGLASWRVSFYCQQCGLATAHCERQTRLAVKLPHQVVVRVNRMSAYHAQFSPSASSSLILRVPTSSRAE